MACPHVVTPSRPADDQVIVAMPAVQPENLVSFVHWLWFIAIRGGSVISTSMLFGVALLSARSRESTGILRFVNIAVVMVEYLP